MKFTVSVREASDEARSVSPPALWCCSYSFCPRFRSTGHVRRDVCERGVRKIWHFVQDNQSFSVSAGTVRGLHFQIPPFQQAKLVRVLRGKIFDVVVDLRRSSATYGKYIGVELSADGGEQLFVPRGFAHGFCTLVENTEIFYKVDAVYSAAHDRGVHWLDPKLGIHWPIETSRAMLSEKDRTLPALSGLSNHLE